MFPFVLTISIPKWSDFNSGNHLNRSDPNSISIPKWSDFNIARQLQYLEWKAFQSQNGLILTRQFFALDEYNIVFQSQNGLILTPCLPLLLIQFRIISIPKWSDFNRAQFLLKSPFNIIIFVQFFI